VVSPARRLEHEPQGIAPVLHPNARQLLDGHHVQVHAPVEEIRVGVGVVDEPQDLAVGQEQEPRTVVAAAADAGE
jgi:hypothetical protein